ncbi:MAG: hypothetical protein ABIO46_07495 [Chitinophagales bacterium]
MLQIKTYSQALEQFTLSVHTSIRAIAVTNDSTMWFAGSEGCYGYTEDSGRHWHIDSIKMAGGKPDFRAMAVTNSYTILLLNAGSPAFLLKSSDHGKTWKTVYTNENKEIFFDALKFWDAKNGIATGDPINGCFTILITGDGGESWNQVPCKQLPNALTGEACFAASNTCLAIFKKNSWIATGGTQSRVLHSDDKGKTWEAVETAIVQGEQLTGIFSIDFYDQKHGIIAGGNYEQPQLNRNTKAISNDNGKSWQLISDGTAPGFCSCVQYQPFSNANTLLIAARPGIYISNDGGMHWEEVKDVNNNPVIDNYNVLQFSPTGKVAWCAGADGKIARIVFK